MAKQNNQLFNMLQQNLTNAEVFPSNSQLVIGFTKSQMLRFNLKDPHLYWFDKGTNTFYDQGSSKKTKKKDWMKITAENYIKANPCSNLKYYIPLSNAMITESNKPLE